MPNVDIDLSQIEKKLDVVVRLLALTITAEDQSLRDKSVTLRQAGLAPKDIAALLGTTRNNVSVALNAARKAGKSKRQRMAKR